jgi:hypothetical protein
VSAFEITGGCFESPLVRVRQLFVRQKGIFFKRPIEYDGGLGPKLFHVNKKWFEVNASMFIWIFGLSK